MTTLIAAGYDKADLLSLVVTYRNQPAEKRLRSAAANAATVVQDLPLVNGLAVRAGGEQRAAFWRELSALTRSAQVPQVWLDWLNKPLLVDSIKQVGAPAAWDRGHTWASPCSVDSPEHQPNVFSDTR
ncbi:hypothetical protein OHA77_24570 [Streptosporangium sp. NBC_01639]|uniref:hypothetical protein n=1 Tax=Streptosporangium sp. NBC_01639 TaxID=2975948 RepID=UPI00386482BF|nr:hypothetical protein OHA77_24570 [Streptosporangium sp. NBC_01639]